MASSAGQSTAGHPQKAVSSVLDHCHIKDPRASVALYARSRIFGHIVVSAYSSEQNVGLTIEIYSVAM